MSRITTQPAVGDGITLHGWSDSHAYTVVALVGTTGFVAQRDNATRVNRAEDLVAAGGFFAHTEHGANGQQWSYEPDTNGAKVKVTLRKDGTWRESGASTSPASEGRHEHYDYNF